MWATPAQADSYLSAGIGGAEWSALTTTEKEQYLETAYRQLVNDVDYSWPTTTTTNQTNANIELANFILKNPNYIEQLNATGSVSGFTIGTFSTQYRGDSEISGERSVYPASIENLIESYKSTYPAVGRITRRTRTDGNC